MKPIFDTAKRIRLGIWGLGRGAGFIHSAAALNIDVVAGCDIHPEIRERFKANLPDAFVTADEDEFLAQDIDAVLIATYFRDHAGHTVKALDAGKHVMCEVTSFYTPAEGVQLVEAVEKSGKVYNLLENYPFTKDNLFLKKLWSDGFFGDFMYAEFEYLHECRALSYAYNVAGKTPGSWGLPVEPGWTVHNWRSSLDYHYYNTHSLGPVMNITGLRPVSVSAPRCEVILPGYVAGRMATACPSMIKMSNGGLVRNLMGGTTNDYHAGGRIWGTKAGAEKIRDLKIRVGGCGNGTLLNMKPEWPEMAEQAVAAGHGGGDFWELYYFAREILTGESAPWNVYSAADVTITGILASRSCKQGGTVIDVPDFRKQADRDRYRDDHGDEVFFDHEHIFPAGHDTNITKDFTAVMNDLYPVNAGGGFSLYQKAMDGMKLYPYTDNDGKLAVIENVSRLITRLPQIAATCRTAETIAGAYPDSIAGKTIRKSLDSVDPAKIEHTEETICFLRNWLENLS